MVSVLSVFWFYKGKFYGDEDIMGGPKVMTYGDYAQLNADHWQTWDTYAKQMGLNPMRVDYDRVPRGRILFHIPTHHFVVVCNSKIIDDEQSRNLLLDYYGLPLNTDFRKDEHYG